MSNPFEDLRQAVVVRPMNSPGPQGAAGPEIKIQYSYDGLSWHDDPIETDRYMRFSTDNEVSWCDPIHYTNLPETLEYVEKARQWAENPENVEVEQGKYSALHYASKAEIAAINAAIDAAEAANELIEPSIEKARQWAENPENIEVESGQYSALHHASKSMESATTAVSAAESAVGALGAIAPPWNSENIYNYDDIVSFDNGHIYKCIGTNIVGDDHAPNINGIDNITDWIRVTTTSNEYFELDNNRDIMPIIYPITNGYDEIFTLDEVGDITYKESIYLEPFTYDTTQIYFVDSVYAIRNASIPTNKKYVYIAGYYGPGTPGGGVFYRDATSSETDNGGTIFVDSDGVRWKRVNVHEEYRASWFGVSTTIPDNSPLIQNAIDAIPHGFTLTFDPGEYYCNQTIRVTKNITIKGSSHPCSEAYGRGKSAKLIYNGTNPSTLTPFLDFRPNYRFAGSIRDMIISGPGKDSNIVGIWMTYCWPSTFDHMWVGGFKYGMQIDNYYFYCLFNDCKFTSCDRGFRANSNGNKNAFNSCTFSSCNVGFTGNVNNIYDHGIQLNDCYFELNTNIAIEYSISNACNLCIDKCYFENNGENVIYIHGTFIDSEALLVLQNSTIIHYCEDIYTSVIKQDIPTSSNISYAINNNFIVKPVPSTGYFIYVISGGVIIEAKNNKIQGGDPYPICSTTPSDTSYFNNDFGTP